MESAARDSTARECGKHVKEGADEKGLFGLWTSEGSEKASCRQQRSDKQHNLISARSIREQYMYYIESSCTNTCINNLKIGGRVLYSVFYCTPLEADLF